MQPITFEWIKRIGLGAIGLILPKVSILSSIVRDVRRAMLATVMTGVLLSSCVLLGCLGLYQFLIAQGLSNLAAMSISGGLLLLMTIISGLVAEKYISKAKRIDDTLTPLDGKYAMSDIGIEPLFQAFIDGLFEEEGVTKHSVEKHKNDSSFVSSSQTDEVHKSDSSYTYH
tara:strand:- start:1112 stop:1624 length:513 start_codon:yes stop_codon:yes gene_type:complete